MSRTYASMFFVAMLLGVAPVVDAADTDAAAETKFLGLTLARGLAEPKIRSKPAEISYTRPDTGPSSATVDAGIEARIGLAWATSISEMAIGVEHHRNTATASKRDIVLAGIAATGGFVGADGALNYRSSVKYKNDRNQGTRGLVAGIDLYPYIPTRLNATAKLASDIYLTPTTSFGLQYERANSASVADTPGGSVFRGVAAAGLHFEIGPRWTTSLDVGYWRDTRQSGTFLGDEKSKIMRRVSLAYKLDDKGNASIALSRTHGSDPNEGIVKEKYTQLVLQLNQNFFSAGK